MESMTATPIATPLMAGGEEGSSGGLTLHIASVLLTAAVYYLVTRPAIIDKLTSDGRKSGYAYALAALAGVAPSAINGASYGPMAQGSLGAIMTGVMAYYLANEENEESMAMRSIGFALYGLVYAGTVSFASQGDDEEEVNMRSVYSSWGAVVGTVLATGVGAVIALVIQGIGELIE